MVIPDLPVTAQARVRPRKFLSLTSLHGNDHKWFGPSFMRCARVSPSYIFCYHSEESFLSFSPFTKLRPQVTKAEQGPFLFILSEDRATSPCFAHVS